MSELKRFGVEPVEANYVAKSILNVLDRDGSGKLDLDDLLELEAMMTQTFKTPAGVRQNSNFGATVQKILDFDQDGYVGLADIEQFVVKYFCEGEAELEQKSMRKVEIGEFRELEDVDVKVDQKWVEEELEVYHKKMAQEVNVGEANEQVEEDEPEVDLPEEDDNVLGKFLQLTNS
jgi:hypothetical protein